MVVQASSRGNMHVAAFVAGFYAFLIGSKVVLSIFAGRARRLITGKSYRYTMQGLGVIMWIFALILARDALKLFLE